MTHRKTEDKLSELLVALTIWAHEHELDWKKTVFKGMV